MSVTPTTQSPVAAVMAADDSLATVEYYAGLIDAQLAVSAVDGRNLRVTLTSNDPRVAEELSAKFRPDRVTIIKRPDKKDQCTALFVGANATDLLTFTAETCVIKKDLAKKALAFMDDKATALEVTSVETPKEMETVTLDWACGFFDVRGAVVAPVAPTEDTKKRRGSIRLALSKGEKFVLPALQKVLNGKIKKSSPCRLVYETKDDIKAFVETVGDHLRAKKVDLDCVTAA